MGAAGLNGLLQVPTKPRLQPDGAKPPAPKTLLCFTADKIHAKPGKVHEIRRLQGMQANPTAIFLSSQQRPQQRRHRVHCATLRVDAARFV